MEALDHLAACLAKLPGIGRRTAERMALRLVRNRDTQLRELIAALQAVEQTVFACPRCGSMSAARDQPCRLCTAPDRDGRLLCVVEDPADVALLERSGAFRGRYHALMGRLSPMRGEGPADLRIEALLKRVRDEGVQEVLLALSTDVEGDATASYVADRLKGAPVTVTRLAYGLPAGSGVSYSDPLTLARAIKGRQSV